LSGCCSIVVTRAGFATGSAGIVADLGARLAAIFRGATRVWRAGFAAAFAGATDFGFRTVLLAETGAVSNFAGVLVLAGAVFFADTFFVLGEAARLETAVFCSRDGCFFGFITEKVWQKPGLMADAGE
jgi:hypothetical protein